MVFSSLQFVLIFMPIFFVCYYLVSFDFKNAVLLLGSMAFYFVGTINSPYHFILFVITIIMDFAVGLGMEKFRGIRKPLLIAGVVFHLISLCIFKYANFIMGELSRISDGFSSFTQIVLPIGISFYTFQGMSYLADVYRGKVKAEKSLLNYAVYISMFEQLIAGPIVTYDTVKNELHHRKITVYRSINGIGIFIFGLGLKVLLANPLGKLWSQTQAIGFESISTPLAWIALIAYTLQIYLDFFGYSLMAIGLGEMLGFKLPKNFNHPYTTVTVTDFWRNWHITLGSWFKEYVYIPLGGSRHGFANTVRNLFIVWILTGIWHGAGYNFLLWGFVLFLLIFIEKLFLGDYLNRHRVIGHIYMAFVIPLSFALFAITDFENLVCFFTRLFPFFGGGVWSVFRYDYLKYLGQYYPFLIIGLLFSTEIPYKFIKKIKSRTVIFIFLATVFFASLYCMYKGFDDPFLYFRF